MMPCVVARRARRVGPRLAQSRSESGPIGVQQGMTPGQTSQPQAGPFETSSAPRAPPRWHLRLLGAVVASDGATHLRRFPSRATAALLARLALQPGRSHARETLIELLWPGVDLAVGRNRLRQTLSSLRSLIEPPGQPGAVVLRADRLSVSLVDGAVGCDAIEFERLARAGLAAQARAMYGGELMPGFYDEWIDDERRRLGALHEALPPETNGAAAGALADAGLAHGTGAQTQRESGAPGAMPPAALPVYLTSLFGADLAVARLRAQLLEHRLVSLVGPGGSGKTRLAVAVAQSFADPAAAPSEQTAPRWHFDRIAFVPLATCTDEAQLYEAVAEALRMVRGAEALERLAAELLGQRVLLVLDNFEQLVDSSAAAVAALLSRLPTLRLLVTTRRVLALDGERCVAAEPLALPGAEPSLAAVTASPAAALFVDRARAARADFHLSERNHAAIAELVGALHGMPLAIELAASRVRSLGVAEMARVLCAALDQDASAGAHLLVLARGGPRSGHDARHASMTQVIAWSWGQLDLKARRMLAVLALFPASAGATAAAACAVRGAEPTAGALQLDTLVRHSLATAQPSSDGSLRFVVHEPVREFALAQRMAPIAAVLRARLRQWLITWARSLGDAPSPTRVAPELAAIYAAFDSALADRTPQDALDLALALRSYWDNDGLPGRSLRALDEALAQLPTRGKDVIGRGQRADMHELLAYLRFEAAFPGEAIAHADAALALAGDEPSRRARALVRRAWIDIASGRGHGPPGDAGAPLRSMLDEALLLARASGDREAQARALHQQAVVLSHQLGDHAGAEDLLLEAQQLWLAMGDKRKAYARLRNRAQCWGAMGRHDDALATFQTCERAAREDGDWVGVMDSLLSLAVAYAQQRQWRASLIEGQRCVQVCWQRWHKHGLAYALWNLPRPLARLRRPEPAMRLMGFAVSFWAQRVAPLSAADQAYVRRVRGLVCKQLGAARTEALWLDGAGLDLAAAVALALRDVD